MASLSARTHGSKLMVATTRASDIAVIEAESAPLCMCVFTFMLCVYVVALVGSEAPIAPSISNMSWQLGPTPRFTRPLRVEKLFHSFRSPHTRTSSSIAPLSHKPVMAPTTTQPCRLAGLRNRQCIVLPPHTPAVGEQSMRHGVRR